MLSAGTRERQDEASAARRRGVSRVHLHDRIDRRKVATTTMPLYEYRCASCKKRVTILTLRASETVDAVCDTCGARTLERLM
jgi:putative FmdB family regulatory protein